MTLLADLRDRSARPSRSVVARVVAAGLVCQVLVSALLWLLLDDSGVGHRTNDDYLRLITASLVATGLLAALAGAATRRWWVTWAVAAGCLLAVVLGCAGYVGHVLTQSV